MKLILIHAVYSSLREFREARSGVTKITEEQANQLSFINRNFLARRPDYRYYMQVLYSYYASHCLVLLCVLAVAKVTPSFNLFTQVQQPFSQYIYTVVSSWPEPLVAISNTPTPRIKKMLEKFWWDSQKTWE